MKTCVRSTALYESRTHDKTDETPLGALEMWCWKTDGNDDKQRSVGFSKGVEMVTEQRTIETMACDTYGRRKTRKGKVKNVLNTSQIIEIGIVFPLYATRGKRPS